MGKTNNSSSSSNNNNLNSDVDVREVYQVTGDAEAAYALLQRNMSDSESVSPLSNYNACLLRQAALQDVDAAAFLVHLQEAQDAYLDASSSSQQQSQRKQQRDKLITTYNRGLALWNTGQALQSMKLLYKILEPLQSGTGPFRKISGDLLSIACRMAFLVLECFLTLSIGIGDIHILPLDCDMSRLYSWLQRSVDQVVGEDAPQLRFLLALYSARLDLHALGTDGKRPDARIRSARKELKTAMEVFQHKLRATDGSNSIASSSVMSDEHNLALQNQQHSAADLSKLLQSQNQAALTLKANTEQLKGNTKKSLILLAEAQTSGTGVSTTQTSNASTTPPFQKRHQDAVHFNNLAIVYATNGKPHLALHAWSKACGALTTKESNETRLANHRSHPEDVVRILFNAGMAALQAQNYMAAYECLGSCLVNSPSQWAHRPRSWLRLAEACLGLWTRRKAQEQLEQKRRGTSNGGSASQIPIYSSAQEEESQRIAQGVLLGDPLEQLRRNASIEPDAAFLRTLVTPADLKNAQENPLPRARCALEQALHLWNEQDQWQVDDEFGLVSASLSLSFVCLETKDYATALNSATVVLNHRSQSDEGKVTSLGASQRALWHRQQATARLYAAEASSALADYVASMRHLVGDGKDDDAIGRLASQLSGVTIGTAASNPKGKGRLAKAQAMVRCSASTASAKLGNLAAAKQLAMSAQAMENAFSSSREGSIARRTLLWCMMKEENSQAALSLLRSSR